MFYYFQKSCYATWLFLNLDLCLWKGAARGGTFAATALFVCHTPAALALAEGLSCEERVPGTCVGLVAIERDPRAAAAARRLISSSPWGHLITVVEADALQWLRSQPRATRNTSSGKVASEGTALGTVSLEGGMLPDGGFDLIYLDAEKKKYSQYIETILDPQRPLLAPRGALLIDNTLWGRGHEGTRPLWWKGTGAEKDAPQARRYASIAESMKNLREALRNDTRISHVSRVKSLELFVFIACIKSSQTIVRMREDAQLHVLKIANLLVLFTRGLLTCIWHLLPAPVGRAGIPNAFLCECRCYCLLATVCLS